MVRAHYDSEPVLRLAGEIHFDAEPSRAVPKSGQPYGCTARRSRTWCTCRVPGTCATPPRSSRRVRGRSWWSTCPGRARPAGLGRNVPAGLRSRVTAYEGDVRDAGQVLPHGSVRLDFLGGSSLGDIATPQGHQRFLRALARSLAPGGVLVFARTGVDQRRSRRPLGPLAALEITVDYTCGGTNPL
ncbi:hypothetical protein [Streptomyces sp. NPDC127039]|uniref:hypothetical protein n=1 Tax=Streptomyces sp. NPDC127039 TaxID=3347115 RepID=UPI00364D63D6